MLGFLTFYGWLHVLQIVLVGTWKHNHCFWLLNIRNLSFSALKLNHNDKPWTRGFYIFFLGDFKEHRSWAPLFFTYVIILNSDNRQVSGKVLVYKDPGLHIGDVHKLTATHIDGLEDIVGDSKYAIFFPTSGSRSLADEIVNSDFDGDMYWVSWNPQVGVVSNNLP